MIEFGLSVAALGAARLGFSPLGELASSLRALGDVDAAPLLRPLLRHVADRVADEDLWLLRLVVPAQGLPDFLYPASPVREVSLNDQLAELAALPVRSYDADLIQAWAPEPVPERLRGEQGRARLVQALRRYDERALAPVRTHMRAALDAEVAHRAERALLGGVYDVFADLHPEVSLDGTRLTVAKGHHACAGVVQASITLVPSVFTWPRLVVVDRSPETVQLHYPVREVGRACDDAGAAEPGEDALAALIGVTRARILRELAAPRSTTQLAQLLDTSPGGISTHLSTLRRNGLVTASRRGRSVLYQRTPLGTSITTAGSAIGQAR
jgi:DNA-binding transcriptional ArsR family regulator